MGSLYCLATVLCVLLSPPAGAAETDSEIVNVFVPKQDGYPAIRIPSIVTSQAGTLLAFAEGRQGGDHSQNDIILKRSFDGGQNWGELQVVHEAGVLSLNNPQAVVLDSGRILLMYQRNKLGEHKAKPGFGDDAYFTLVQHSDDDGQTWSSPRDVSRDVKRAERVTSVASGPGIGIVLQRGEHRGRILMPMNEGPYGDWRVYAAISDDDGQTWRYGERAPEDGSGHGNEVQMVELADGSVMLNARTQGGGTKHRKVAISEDGGETWSQLRDDVVLVEPVCQASLLRYSWPEQDRSRILFLNPANQKSRTGGVLRVSYDEGKSWPIGKTVYADGFAYSCMSRLSDGRIGILFERDNYATVCFQAVTLDWLEKN
jgi:sialidase-1